jgi:hypothetical protein
MLYLDSAAVVKLAHAEAESQALRDWLAERSEQGWVSSVLTEVESFRALARYAPDAVGRLPAVLDHIDLVDLSPRVRMRAQAVRPATVRSLDAIHLGTALEVGADLSSFVTYGKRLLEAARVAGLAADAPARAGLSGGVFLAEVPGQRQRAIVRPAGVPDARYEDDETGDRGQPGAQQDRLAHADRPGEHTGEQEAQG